MAILARLQPDLVVATDGTGDFKFALVDGGGHPSIQAKAKANVTGMFVTSITVEKVQRVELVDVDVADCLTP